MHNHERLSIMQSNSVQNIRETSIIDNNRHGDQTLRKISHNHLGWVYQNGYGVEKNYSVAFDCYKRAADQNDAKAQNNLGFMYENGLGVAKNAALAMKWYMKSANQGCPETQYNLGCMYQEGIGIYKNMEVAIGWYKKAATKGHPESQYNLGLIYENGDGVAEDLEVALEWYEKAAVQQNSDAQYRLGLIFDGGLGVTEDIMLAVKWYEKAASQGHEESQYILGTLYENGRGVIKNKVLAKTWYQKSAAQGHKLAQRKLNEDTTTHKFNCSFKINDQFYDNYEDIYCIASPVSILLTITYIGSVELGNNIIINEKINNPYQEVLQQVTAERDKSQYYNNCSKAINICCNFILSCIGMRYVTASNNNSQNILAITKTKCNQFWKQKTEEKLKEAEYLVDEIIEQKYGLEVRNSLDIARSSQGISIEQQYNYLNTNNQSHLSVQSVQDDSKDSLVLPKKEDNPLKFRSPIFNRYRYS